MKSALVKKNPRILFVIILWLIGTAIYSNTFDNKFVFDDLPGFATNDAIRDITKLKPIWNYYGTRFIGFYTFALNYHFHQLDPFGYHVVNLIIHLINATLVWWFIILIFKTPRMKESRETKDKEYLAFFVALIFLTHPLQTQAVTYVYQRLASLATLFYLLAACLYVNGRIHPQQRVISFIGGGASAILGMLTKENVFTLPFAIILIEFTFLKISPIKEKRSRRWKYILPILLFSLVVPFLYRFQVSDIFTTQISLTNNHPEVTSGNYLLTQFRVIVTYIRLLFLPYGQNLDYDFPLSRDFFELPTLVSFLFLLSIFLLALRLFKKYPLLAFGIFWFFLTLLVESSIIPIRHVIFEHRVYLPMLGFCTTFCAGIYYFLKNLKKVAIAIGITAIIFSILTYQRNDVWQDSITLWSDIVKKTPNQSRSYDNLASAYIDVGDYNKAIPNLEKAIQLDPKNAESYNNLGLVYLNTNRLDKAIEQFHIALTLWPNYAVAYNNLGVAFAKKDDLKSAERYFLLSAQLSPNYINSRLNLADIYRREGRLDQAIEYYQLALRLNPSQKECLYALAGIYFDKNALDQAREIGEKILKKTNDVNLLTNSGSLFAKNNLNEMAIKFYTKALTKDPQNRLTHLELGKLYGNLGYFDEAIAVWQKGLQLYPDDTEFLRSIQMARELIRDRELKNKNN